MSKFTKNALQALVLSAAVSTFASASEDPTTHSACNALSHQAATVFDLHNKGVTFDNTMRTVDGDATMVMVAFIVYGSDPMEHGIQETIEYRAAFMTDVYNDCVANYHLL